MKKQNKQKTPIKQKKEYTDHISKNECEASGIYKNSKLNSRQKKNPQ